MITKTDSLSVLIKKADDVFSKYIRKSRSINGFCKCFVCSRLIPVSIAQNGHYINRDQMPTRYDEMNCNPVCHECNCLDPNHNERYALAMVLAHGIKAVVALEAKAKGLQKYMRHELIELIEEYKEKLKRL